MGVLWCAKFPRVTVPAATPKPITIILPYYENAGFLRRQIAGWEAYPGDLKRWLSAIIVDDGSPEPAVLPEERPFPIRLFRIEIDIRWNWLAARNIGAHHAKDGWLLLTDMDHVLPEETAQALIHGDHDPSVVYAFSRREHTGEQIAPHSASFLMTREMFWKIGGYDERMSGFYGSDGHYRRRLASIVSIRVLSDELVRHEHQSDSSTVRYKRKQPEDARLRSMVARFARGSKPKVLSFPYHEVMNA